MFDSIRFHSFFSLHSSHIQSNHHSCEMLPTCKKHRPLYLGTRFPMDLASGNGNGSGKWKWKWKWISVPLKNSYLLRTYTLYCT